MQELQGAVAIVTGAFRGIGLATACELAAAGARVAMVNKDQSRAGPALAEMPEGSARTFICDVTDADCVAEMVDVVEAELGPVSILVNNAGLTRDKLLLRMQDEDWDLVLNVNLKAAFNLTKIVARGMTRRRAGAIINVSSVVGLMGNTGQANYSAAKAGLIGLTKSVAKELAPRGIRVNAVAPGFIQTQMTAHLDAETREGLLGQIPMGELGRPEDVAPVIRFLAGPGARYITGQVIVVDGGMLM
ncbi:MAG: 3-oxoacyl-[acyl-carrier-protein] reductase [Gemmatimonadota bacterium]|nr:MAG: 3-oxoacyl-[acyl-carrier-protein] reductase [Gemmatimonadota bacterium]